MRNRRVAWIAAHQIGGKLPGTFQFGELDLAPGWDTQTPMAVQLVDGPAIFIDPLPAALYDTGCWPEYCFEFR